MNTRTTTDESPSRTSAGSSIRAAFGYAGATVAVGALLVWEMEWMPSVFRRVLGHAGGELAMAGITLALGFLALRRISTRIRRAAGLPATLRAHLAQSGLLYAYLVVSAPWLVANLPSGRPAPPWVLGTIGALCAALAITADYTANRRRGDQ